MFIYVELQLWPQTSFFSKISFEETSLDVTVTVIKLKMFIHKMQLLFDIVFKGFFVELKLFVNVGEKSGT